MLTIKTVKNRKLTHARCLELFEYQPNGTLIRRVPTGRSTRAGTLAGGLGSDGYYSICVDNVGYKLHTIIFLYHHGYIPENQIDHIDRNKLNNKIENLREVSITCNRRNMGVFKNNTSGIPGVLFLNGRNKWCARIKVNGISIHLGNFTFKEDAIRARYNKELELNWNKCATDSEAYKYLKNKGLI